MNVAVVLTVCSLLKYSHYLGIKPLVCSELLTPYSASLSSPVIPASGRAVNIIIM